MRRLVAALLAAFAFLAAAPAGAQSFGGYPLAVLMGGGCNRALKVDVGARSYCLSSQRYGTLTAAPGVTFSRAGSAYAASSNGILTLFATNVLRQTDQGILAEPAATNIVLQSQHFTTSWTANAGTPTDNQVAAPDNTVTAAQYAEDGNSSQSHGPSQLNLSVAANTTYSASVYLKYIARQWVRIAFADASSALINTTWFDIQNCLVGSHTFSAGTWVAATASPSGNGFCRVTVTTTTAGVPSTVVQLRLFGAPADNSGVAYVGLNAAAFNMWGAQLAAEAKPSSYVPTTTTAVARATDVLSIAFTPNGSSASVTYNGGSATPSGTSPLNLGGSSGGTWLGSYITAFSVNP